MTAGQNLDVILGIIDTYIADTGGISEVVHNNTGTITLAGLGTTSSPLTATYTGSTAIPTLNQVTTAGAVSNNPIQLIMPNSFLVSQGSIASAIVSASIGASATGGGFVSQWSTGSNTSTFNIITDPGTGTGRVYLDASSPLFVINSNSGLNVAFGGNITNTFNANGNLTGANATLSNHFVTLGQISSLVPGPTDYIANQTASIQTGGYKVSGNGYVFGTMAVGTSFPGEKFTVASGNMEIRSSVPYTNIGGSAYLIFKDVNGVQLGAVGDTSSNNPDIYLTATVSNNIKFVNLPVGVPPANADAYTTAWFDTNLNMGIGVPVAQTIGARLHLQSTTEQLRIGYNTTVYSSTTITSTGNSVHQLNGNLPSFVFNSPVGVPGGLWTGTTAPASTAYTNSNFGVFGGAVASSAVTAGILFGGASTVAYRAAFNGITSTAISTGISASNVIIGANGFTTAGVAGVHPVIANLAITLPAVTINVGTVADVANLYIDTPSAVGTNNWGIYTRSGASRFGGAMSHAIVATTTDLTLTTAHYCVLATGSSPVTITLPPATLNVGRLYNIKRVGTANVVIDPNAAELIDGVSTKTLATQYVGVQIICDGTGWHIINAYSTAL